MAKKKNNSNTPIEFGGSDSEFGVRGPRVPIPDRHPNWEYGSYTDAKPNVHEWILAVILWTGTILLAVFFVSEAIYTESQWLIVIICGINAILWTISISQRTIIRLRKKKGKAAQSRRKNKQGNKLRE
ncbi:MAG: hypothetical protein QY328_09830 [Anaerolineales bacterium]|nr:hypothetical protein [Anaerolineales bacterium]WKZ38552.1 MAG: hypothetical protein QY328_09830 [Anaerolineales bacterium]